MLVIFVIFPPLSHYWFFHKISHLPPFRICITVQPVLYFLFFVSDVYERSISTPQSICTKVSRNFSTKSTPFLYTLVVPLLWNHLAQSLSVDFITSSFEDKNLCFAKIHSIHFPKNLVHFYEHFRSHPEW